ncbi:MAG: hypothetical protein OXB84_01665 [Halobacteriovoraceae bacterium]|nr:hypothetical protein [Halobacteriovoraceae bacterium]
MHAIINNIPNILCKAPYLFSFHLAKTFLNSPHVDIWYRHSLYFNNITPGLSDIDTDLFFLNKTNFKLQKKTLKRFLILKKYIPLLSEVNIYEEDTVDFIRDCINPLELQRDPLLLKKINIPLKKPSMEEKLIFTIKMLYSDRKNLLLYPNLRKKKWNFHFKQLDINDNIKNLNLTKILNILDRHVFSHFPQIAIKEILEQYLKKDQIPSSFSSIDKKRSYFLLFPNQFYSHEFSDSFLKEIFSKMDGHNQKIYIEPIKWELWGLYTQYKIIGNKFPLIPHLKRLSKTIDYLNNDYSFLKNKFEYLEQLVSEWNQNIK